MPTNNSINNNAITTIAGDTGTISGASVSILAGTASQNCGSSVSFTNSGTVSTFNTTDGSGNVIIGSGSGSATLGGNTNVVIGQNSYQGATTGQQNVVIGANALQNATNDSDNVFIGQEVAQTASGSLFNVFLGAASGFNLINGQQNTAVGYNSLPQTQDGSYNVGIGASCGTNYEGPENSNILIMNAGVQDENNTIHIGTQGTGSGQQNVCYIAGIHGATVTGSAVLVSTSGQLGDVVSSKEFKENIQDIGDESSTLLNLRPVRFNYKSDPNQTTSYGMIAEEVDTIFPELVVYKDNKPYSLKYHEMPALILNEMQKMAKRIDELEKQIGKTHV